MRTHALVLALALVVSGCGDDGETPETGIAGRVTDATTGAAIPGARVVAINGDTGASASTVAITDSMGAYRVVLEATTATRFTLRVSAERYQDFPSPVRQAIPVQVTAEADVTRDVTLLPIPGADPAMLGSISGTTGVAGATVAGVLVIAEGGGRAQSTVSDAAGAFVLFNLPAGTYTLRGYRVGQGFTSVDVTLTAGEDKAGVALAVDAAAQLSRITGGINIVNPQTTTTETLIVLAVASTGEVPPGLSKMTVNKAFEISDVPPGAYDILASFNNDDLVLDPDPSQLPRPIRINLPADAPGGMLATGSFKVTGDVGIVGPGTGALEELPVAAAGLTLRWMDDSSEDFYGIEVIDAFGTRIWGSASSRTVEPVVKSAKNTSSIAYGGPALTPGQVYQWRITSYQCKVTAVPCTMMDAIAYSENLRGVFQIALP